MVIPETTILHSLTHSLTRFSYPTGHFHFTPESVKYDIFNDTLYILYLGSSIFLSSVLSCIFMEIRRYNKRIEEEDEKWSSSEDLSDSD